MELKHFEMLYPTSVRKIELPKVAELIKEGNAAQIISLPGVGRSTLLQLLAHNKTVREEHFGQYDNRYHFVLADLSEIRNRPLFDLNKFIFLSLVDSLRERQLEEEYHIVNDIFKESLSYQDELVLFQGLKSAVNLLALEKKMAIVFMFDRFEEYIPTVTPEFFTNLRALRDRAKYRFSVIFALSRPLEDQLEPQLISDYYDYLADHYIYLSLSDKDINDFRFDYAQKVVGKTLSEKLLTNLQELTGGHLRLTRLAIDTLIHIDTPSNLKTFLLQQKSIQKAMSQIWQSLRPSEQKHLKLILEGKPDNCESEQYLKNIGLIKNNALQIPLLADFIKEEGKTQNRNLQIHFNQNTNEIFKGEQNISENLTGAEFRLLSFLLEHQNEIVDREAVINAVWKDNATTAGVTDQALDQLMLRVRKKIEEDVKAPKHLQTIKGRGFRLTS